jgi:hypothetical protein
MNSQASAQEAPPQDWRLLEISAPITVIDPKGFSYEAWVEEKTRDSHIVWVRRWDLGSRHLVERHDGFRLVPLPQDVDVRHSGRDARR